MIARFLPDAAWSALEDANWSPGWPDRTWESMRASALGRFLAIALDGHTPNDNDRAVARLIESWNSPYHFHHVAVPA